MYELIAGQPLLDVNGLEGYQARLAALHTMDLQVSCLLVCHLTLGSPA